MGDYKISVKALQDFIDKYSKLDHNLVLSDIYMYVKDRQNYASCLKISSLHVLDITYDAKVTAEMSKPSSLVWYTIER